MTSYFYPSTYIEMVFSSLANGLNDGVKTFFETLDVDGISTLAKSATKIFIDNFDAEASSAEAIEKINKIFTAALNNLDLGNKATTLGKEFSQSFQRIIQELSPTLTNEATKVIQNFSRVVSPVLGKEAAKSIRNFARATGPAIGESAGKIFHQITINALPYIVLTNVVILGTSLSLFYLYYRAKHEIGKEQIPMEVRNVSWLTPIYNPISDFVSSILTGRNTHRLMPIFNKEISEKITKIIAALQNRRFMENLLLDGPSGTGKAMIAEKIAEESGLRYVRVSALQISSEWKNLMDMCKKKPTLLYIDHAEALSDAFLNETSRPSANLVIVLGTSHKNKIDKEVSKRMDHKISISLPGKKERIEILKSQIDYFFTDEEREKMFPEKLIQWMAYYTSSFSGRDLFKLVNVLHNRADNPLSKGQVEAIVRDFIKSRS